MQRATVELQNPNDLYPIEAMIATFDAIIANMDAELEAFRAEFGL